MFEHSIKIEMSVGGNEPLKFELPTRGEHLLFIQAVDQYEEHEQLFRLTKEDHFLILDYNFYHVFHTYPDSVGLKLLLEELTARKDFDIGDCTWGPFCFDSLEELRKAMWSLRQWQIDNFGADETVTSGENFEAALSLFSRAKAVTRNTRDNAVMESVLRRHPDPKEAVVRTLPQLRKKLELPCLVFVEGKGQVQQLLRILGSHGASIDEVDLPTPRTLLVVPRGKQADLFTLSGCTILEALLSHKSSHPL